ncbi:MAG TPA: glutathione S-transferase family protein, partial [Myxococcota bacterium]|nr:glutathione S-transferase family protein [Myxococcota bacterium]
MSQPGLARVYGNIVSPYARKVYLTLEWKGLPFEALDVLPHADTPVFREISPLGKIPAFEDDLVRLCDSSVICDYLEHRHPDPPIYPRDPALRARALWLEEYADTALQDLVLRGIVLERLIKPTVRNEPTDETRLKEILENRLPPELDYLEAQILEAQILEAKILEARIPETRAPESRDHPDRATPPGSAGEPEAALRFLVGDALSIADLAVTTAFVNARAADFEVDARRWPALSDYLERMQAHPLFAQRAIQESEY